MSESEFFSGTRLIGDDFDQQQLEEWYCDEEEGYSRLISVGRHSYGYHALNEAYGYAFVKDAELRHVLGVGAASGDEFLPIAGRVTRFSILDPSEMFSCAEIVGKPVSYVKPRVDGGIPYKDSEFDLITCFGALHHIPNVTKVVSEMARCACDGGRILIREPIISLGDWRTVRRGLTKRERGIPLALFRDIIARAGLEIVSERLCMFPGITKIFGDPESGGALSAYNSKIACGLDALLSSIFRGNIVYHTPKFEVQSPWLIFSKLRPTNVFFVLKKSAANGN